MGNSPPRAAAPLFLGTLGAGPPKGNFNEKKGA